MLPADVPISWEMLPEPVPGHGPDAGRTFVPVRLPHNMLLETRDETDYGAYRAAVHSASTRTASLRTHVADLLCAFVNGRFVGAAPGRLKENRTRRGDFAVSLSLPLRKGDNELVLVVSSMGLVKHDVMLGRAMSKERKGLIGAVTIDGRAVRGWQFSPATWGEAHLLPLPEAASLVRWRRPARGGGPFRWYRGTFALAGRHLASGAPWALDVGGLFKGLLWINGNCLGRYWQEPSRPDDLAAETWQQEHVHLEGVGAPPQRFYQIPPDWLREGANTLIVLEERGALPGAAGLVRRK